MIKKTVSACHLVFFTRFFFSLWLFYCWEYNYYLKIYFSLAAEAVEKLKLPLPQWQNKGFEDRRLQVRSLAGRLEKPTVGNTGDNVGLLDRSITGRLICSGSHRPERDSW